MLITPNLALPYIDVNEAQREVIHNDAIRGLDALVQLAVLDRDLASPPGAPADGERWIVASSPTGAWASHAAEIAAWQDDAWRFYTPRIGWFVYIIDEGALIAWNGSSWVDALSMMTSLQNMTLLGIGTTADTSNPLSAKLNNTLWAARTVAEGGDGDLRYKMSKEATANTLSLLMQTNFSGRAEVGLTGDDDFHFKVSPDGSSWLEAIVIDKSTGVVSFPQGDGGSLALAFNGIQVNGGVDVSQELGTSGATLSSGTAKYTADCWEAKYVHGAGTAVVTSAQVAAASFPSALSGFNFGHQVKATTAISSPANGDYALHRQKIEGYRVAKLGWGAAGAQSLAYAFQFYSTEAGTAFVKFSNSDYSRCYYGEFAVSAGWNFVSGTIDGDTSGTWDTTSGTGLIIEIFSAGKAASPATPDAWGSTDTTQTTNSTNLLGTNNNLTIVTGLFVVPGTVPPTESDLPLLMRSYDQELRNCQRYWEASYNQGTAPGSTSGTNIFWATAASIGSGYPYLAVNMKLTKRDTPTVTLYSYLGTSGRASDGLAADLAASSAVANGIGKNVFYVQNSSGGGLTPSGGVIGLHYVANARL
jgi:Protein of unknown function (DUF2793)